MLQRAQGLKIDLVLIELLMRTRNNTLYTNAESRLKDTLSFMSPNSKQVQIIYAVTFLN